MRKVFVFGTLVALILGGLLFIPAGPVLFSAAPPVVDTTTVAATSGGAETTLTLVEATTTTLYVWGQITDPDGCADVAVNGTVTGKFYRSNLFNTYNCSADNNDCYAISNNNCAKTGCAGPGDNSFNYECTIPIQYYADSTTAGTHLTTDWTARITATDAAQTTGVNADIIEMNTTIAHNVIPTVAYGTIDLGQESAEQVFSIENTGNSGIDIDFSVNGDMVCNNGTVPAGNVHYASTSGFPYANAIPLSTTATEYELDLTPRSNDSQPASKPLFFKLKLPDAGLAGTCSNTLTTVSKADTEGGW